MPFKKTPCSICGLVFQTSTTPQPDGLLLDEFEKSVTMSTYLVAFIVANMSSVSRNVSGTEVV